MHIHFLGECPESLPLTDLNATTLPWPGSDTWAAALAALRSQHPGNGPLCLLAPRALTAHESKLLLHDCPQALVWQAQALNAAAVATPVTPPAPAPSLAHPAPSPSPTPSPAAARAEPPAGRQKSVGQLSHDMFVCFARGQQREGQHLFDHLIDHADLSPQEREQLVKRCRQGQHAQRVWTDLQKQLKTGRHSPQALEQVHQAVAQESSNKVRDFLKSNIKRELKFKQAKQDSHVSGYRVQLPKVQLAGEPHPHSLRHLAPAPTWHVYIDETGHTFNENELAQAPPTGQGRLVALVMTEPVRQQLKPLPSFHATTAKGPDIDRMLTDLLRQPVGVLGIEVQDPLVLPGASWFSSVMRLAEWVMRLLPIAPDQATRVHFHIEERGENKSDLPMLTHAQWLESMLKRLHAQRYAHCQLRLDIHGKSQCEYLSYVDALAHTWGSPSAPARERLRQGQWLGHCFIRTDQHKIMRLYMAHENDRPLLPAEWYELMALTASEPAHGILPDWLRQVGKRVQTDPDLWLQYQQEVQQRLASKQYRLADIGQAVDWLDSCTPTGLSLPPLARLHGLSNQLVRANHTGRASATLLEQAHQLSQHLQQENLREVCEIQLRMATALTNEFDFAGAKALIEPWTDPSLYLAIGTLNRAKALSSMGQNLAFELQPDAALQWFDQALHTFATLSDPAQAQREARQTRTYRDICLCDDPTQGPALQDSLQHHHGPLLTYTQQMAASNDTHQRYAHHLLLRALVMHPETFAEEAHSYLQAVDHWDSGDEHPWPLINFYRALLLLRAGHENAAQTCAAHAIQVCEEHEDSALLLYMAQVMRWLFAGWGGHEIELPTAQRLDTLRPQLPRAPLHKLYHAPSVHTMDDLLVELHALLPFNFH